MLWNKEMLCLHTIKSQNVRQYIFRVVNLDQKDENEGGIFECCKVL